MFTRIQTVRKALLSSVMIGSTLSLASCLSPDQAMFQEANATAQTETVWAATVKPGASITMNYEAPQNLGVGQYGILKLSFSDSYNAGTLKLEARPDEGLRFVSEVAEKEMSLAGNKANEWELDVTSSKDGIYYVSIFAVVKLPNGSESSRSFSARIDVGDITKAGANSPNKISGTLSSDGGIVIMEAEEIIR